MAVDYKIVNCVASAFALASATHLRRKLFSHTSIGFHWIAANVSHPSIWAKHFVSQQCLSTTGPHVHYSLWFLHPTDSASVPGYRSRHANNSIAHAPNQFSPNIWCNPWNNDETLLNPYFFGFFPSSIFAFWKKKRTKKMRIIEANERRTVDYEKKTQNKWVALTFADIHKWRSQSTQRCFRHSLTCQVSDAVNGKGIERIKILAQCFCEEKIVRIISISLSQRLIVD